MDDAEMTGDGIQLPTTNDKEQHADGEEWNYVNHEDARQKNSPGDIEPKKETSWFGFM